MKKRKQKTIQIISLLFTTDSLIKGVAAIFINRIKQNYNTNLISGLAVSHCPIAWGK